MSEFIPYSEKQKILTPGQWEEMRILDQNCATVKAATEMMRAIVARLLKIDETGTVNVNDFEFLVCDEEGPNAGFIADYHTQNHKSIILITSDVTKLCKTEAQLAGVLAHELGHFTYKKLYGKSKNTIFQERFSDVHALDFMIAGGYDPEAYSEVCEEMRYKNRIGSSIVDVHGSDMARKEDVDAYLAKLHLEKGDFKITSPTGLYKNFTKVMDSRQDRYTSYFDGLIAKNFPKTSGYIDSVYLPPINQVFDLILSEMKNGRFNNSQRVQDMLLYIRNYKRQTKHEIRSTQNFLEQLIDLQQKDPILHKLLYQSDIAEMATTLKKKFRGGKPFKIFEPITKDLDEIKKFMKTREFEHAKNFLTEYKSFFSILEMKDIFGVPTGFKMPIRAIAKGHIMPTNWFYSEFRDTRLFSGLGSTLRDIGFDCKYDWLTDEELKIGWKGGYGGKILTTNKKEIKKIRDDYGKQKVYKEAHDNFQDFIFAINILYDFETGKISAADLISSCREYSKQKGKTLSDTSIVYWLHQKITLTDYKHRNGFLKDDLQELNNSIAFAELYIKPFLAIVKEAMHKENPELANEIRLDTPPRGQTWLEYLQFVAQNYLEIKEDAELPIGRKIRINGKLVDNIKNMAMRHGFQNKDDIIWNVPVGPIVWHVSCLYSEKLHSTLAHFVDTAVQQGAHTTETAASVWLSSLKEQASAPNWIGFSDNKILDKIYSVECQIGRTLEDDIVEHYSVYASGRQWIVDDYVPIRKVLYKEIRNKTDMHKIRRMLSATGMLARNEQDLVDIFSKPIISLSKDRNCYEIEKRLKECVLTYYMRKNSPIKKLYPILFATRNDRITKFKPDFANELGLYIEQHNLIPTDFQSMYDLHAVMEHLKLFSREKPDQARLLGNMVQAIKKMPRREREECSWKLLSGFYYSEDDDRMDLNREDQYMNFPLVKNDLLEIYSSTVAERLGRDDNSEKYFAKIQEIAEFINQEHFGRKGLDKVTQGRLYRLITDKIQSQERVSQFLANDKTIVLSDADAQDKDLLGQRYERVLNELSQYPDLAIYTIEFLNEKLTTKSVSEYCRKCMGSGNRGSIADELVAAHVENYHHMFWSSGLKVRAIIMNKLLNRAFETLDERIKYVCDMNFEKNSPYRADAEMVCDCVIKSFESYEQGLILAAIASADENKQEGIHASRSVGDGLRMFFENMGPAWVKFGQLLSYVPNLPSEIRRDLGKLKDRADMPARWDVYKWLHKAMPDELYNRIERVEDIVGAGSFWMTAIVQVKNNNGDVEKKVVQLLRPDADARAESGFKTIEKAIAKLVKRKASYKVLQNVARQAHESAKYEVDVVVGNKQYEKAKELYGDVHVNIDGTRYTPRVADWRYYGVGKDGMAYKIMDYAKGDTLSRVKVDDNERRKMALAYFTIEMVNLFKGDVWDIDRHQGQQNFDIVSPTNIDINIYDTGAQLPKAPDNKNKVLLANIFFGLMRAIQSKTPLESYLLKTIKYLDKLQDNLNVDVSYVSNVEKGLLALTDIIEYQKEIKDADGNVIQERKTLSDEDLKNAIIAVLQNPSVDKYINVAIKARVVINKLKHLDIKELKELAKGSDLGQDNPVKIVIKSKPVLSRSFEYHKDTKEIDALDNPNDYILGIKKVHVKQQSAPAQNVGNQPQKVA